MNGKASVAAAMIWLGLMILWVKSGFTSIREFVEDRIT